MLINIDYLRVIFVLKNYDELISSTSVLSSKKKISKNCSSRYVLSEIILSFSSHNTFKLIIKHNIADPCLLAYWMSGTKARREVAIRASCRRLFNLILFTIIHPDFPHLLSLILFSLISITLNSRYYTWTHRARSCRFRRCDAKKSGLIWSERSRDD